MKTKEGIAKLREDKKRKFNQTLDLVVNLKNFDVRKEALNTFVMLPHPMTKKVGAFLSKRSKLVDTITEADFDNYKDPKAVKKLARKYDVFISIPPLMSKIAAKFGRVFGPMNKMPNPQTGIVAKEDDATIEQVLKKVGKSVKVRNKELAIKLPIGKEDMSDEHLIENIDSVVKSLFDKLPRKNDNVKEVLIKFTMSKPVKISEGK